MPKNVRIYKYSFTVNSFKGKARGNVILMASEFLKPFYFSVCFNYLKVKVIGNPLTYSIVTQTA